MSSKYVDTTSIIQVIGNIFNNPSLLDLEDKYIISDEDFVNDFHKIVFGSIYKIHEFGASKVTIENIIDFLSSRPKYEAIFNQNKGAEWLTKIAENAIPESFDYYYNRLKKFSLLRAYDRYGINVRDIYDPDNILDSKRKQMQEDLLDNSSLEDIANKVESKIEKIRTDFVEDGFSEASQAAEGIRDLIEGFKTHPEIGMPLYGPLVNTVTRGARLGKFYLRSAPTGLGKTRALIADACYIACDKIYYEGIGWIDIGSPQPTLFIATEQDLSEVQSMMLAFLSNVNEEHILNGRYEDDEESRVLMAAEILERAPLYIEELPDFSLQDVENKIKKNLREHNVRYIMYDYIHTSMKILEEITRRSGGVKLREDNILFMLSTRLKDLCNQYEVFILSSTQLNSSYQDSETPDQNLLRGAKSIADRIDLGEIMLGVSDDDLIKLEPIIASKVFEPPTIKISVYKNRRGRYKGIYLWCRANLGTCRIEPMFCTDYRYELINIDNLVINFDEPSAFEYKE